MDSQAANTGGGLATASLVLGILAVAFSIFLFGGLFGVLGLVFGLVHLARRKKARAFAGWGVGLSAVGLALALACGFGYAQIVKQFKEAMAQSAGAGLAAAEWEGVPAPDIEITTLDGETIALRDLRGRRVVLDFFATWCPPCTKEIPHFVRLVKESSRDDLVVIGISSEEAQLLRPFVKEKGVNYAVGTVAERSPPYASIRSIPTTFFIDRNGIIQRIFAGYHNYGSLRAEALNDDYEGEPKEPPAAVEEGTP